MGEDTRFRCYGQAPGLMRDYHDREWGVPSRDDRHLFEMLILEGAQAGLSWEQVLRRRDAYRAAFRNFDVKAVAALTDADLERLLKDPGIIRNKLKISAARKNAQAVLKLMEEGQTLSGFLWSFVGGKPIQNNLGPDAPWPAESAEAGKMSKELKKRGFTFVGPVICYAFMQAVGMVNDHKVNCYRHGEVAALSAGR